ncbi:type II secretion system protein GspL [Limnohabitans sp.]|jgi:general secretion pathway protein L|uniref:type II secretion system protein GspL n=1 Tax=Limnohabitans sp. TaxID=1907725 RepID=UPI0037C16727
MRTLIIQLPLGLPSPTLSYPHAVVQTESSAENLSMQWACASLLPATNRQTEVLALLPAMALSWHRVDLPPGLQAQSTKLQSALQGLLEDRLLDDPAQLHMALQPDWKTTARPWVAVCHRQWLDAHLQALEQVGLSVHRIVPEFNPSSALAFAAQLQVTGLGEADAGWLWVSHPERGVWGQPMQALRSQSPDKALGLTAEDRQSTDIQAEPGVVALTSELMGETARLIAPGQHWVAAMAADWDLAQFDLRANARSRHIKNGQRAVSTFWHSPAWRPARWGLWLLLASQLVGLNAWAWKTRADWQTQQESWAVMLREAFPQTQVVVDAPLQMAREVERLRQASGQLTPSDLESMLGSLGQAMPAGLAAPREWTYQPGQLRLQGFKPSNAEQQKLQQTLQSLGYRWRAEGDAWLVSIAPTAQAKP